MTRRRASGAGERRIHGTPRVRSRVRRRARGAPRADRRRRRRVGEPRGARRAGRARPLPRRGRDLRERLRRDLGGGAARLRGAAPGGGARAVGERRGGDPGGRHAAARPGRRGVPRAGAVIRDAATAPPRASFREATARRRLLGLLDPGTVVEALGPAERVTSPHLAALGLPIAFDDGVVVAEGRLEGAPVLAASGEGGFMGGSVGEVHGAKLVGLLRRARRVRPRGVVLLLDSGGVRLMGIVARCCDTIAMSEEGRLGLSGPDVVEATKGVEELDASDRALVWRTYGGKHRWILGEADLLVDDEVGAFRAAAVELLGRPRPIAEAKI